MNIDREPWPSYLALTILIPIVIGFRDLKFTDFNSLCWTITIIAFIFLMLYLNAIYVCGKKHDYIKILEPKANKYDDLISKKVDLIPNEKDLRASGETDNYKPRHARSTTITPN